MSMKTRPAYLLYSLKKDKFVKILIYGAIS